jgi:hypothetical protein
MIKRNTAQSCIDGLVWNYAAGDVKDIIPVVVSDEVITGFVYTRKQYGFGHYVYRIDRAKKTVEMRGHVAHYTSEDCVSSGGEVRIDLS